MTSFFINCWDWIVLHRDDIVTFLTSGTFVTILSMMFALFKQSRAYKANTKSLNLVNKNSENVTDMKNDVIVIKGDASYNKEVVTDLQNKVGKLQNDFIDFTELSMAKLNAMLDVQTLVYSTIKDDNIRRAVNSILVDAKYCEANAKAKLEKELEELKEKFKNATENITETVVDTVDKVKNVMSSTTEIQENVITRY